MPETPRDTPAKLNRLREVISSPFLSNALQASAAELLHWYALRWQIELFFKEMKSQLGLSQYQVRDFARVVSWVNLCVLSFCYLEQRRRELLEQSQAEERRHWETARAQGLRAWLREEVEKADLLHLLSQAKDRAGRKRLNALIAAGYDGTPCQLKRRKTA